MLASFYHSTTCSYSSENRTNRCMLGPILLLSFWLQFKIIQRPSILFISDMYTAQSNPKYIYTLATQFFLLFYTYFVFVVVLVWLLQYQPVHVLLLCDLIRASELLSLLLFYLTFLEFLPCSKKDCAGVWLKWL